MGIQINGQTDTISAVDGTMTFPGTVTYEDVSRINVVGVVTAASFNSTTGNVVITENANVMFQNSARDTNRGAIQFTDGGDFRLRSGGALSESLRVSAGGTFALVGGGTVGSPAVSLNGSAPSNSMVLSTAGVVTKALQPRFHADMFDGGIETNQTAYDGRDVSSHRVEYSNTQYDIGGNFTTSGSNKGLFTVPVAGLYLFHASASIQLGANWGQSWFIVNGSRVRGTDWVLATSSPRAMNSTQLYLSEGATVGFHPYNNSTNITISGSRYHTYFKGCLLG